MLQRVEAKTLLDVGCGDFTWMKAVDLPCRYVGIDIVPSVIAGNERAHGSATRRFAVIDAVSEPLPEADVVLCREILFHLSFEDALCALRNIVSGDREYLIATTDRNSPFNSDIATGDFRLLNLQRRPFRFPEPMMEIGDSAMNPTRVLAAWRVGDIRAALDV